MSPAAPACAPWSLPRKIAFRFAFAYWALYCFPVPFGLMDAPAWMQTLPLKAWNALTVWTGRHVLHLASPAASHPTGSGDTLYDWVRLLCVAVLALLVTGLWSWLDRRRPDYERLQEYLRIYLRYVLAAIMLGYGVVKVFPTQFSTPEGDQLLRTYGQSSPMGLLWTFMGASKAYTIFGGLGEVAGALFLLFRRTATLGAMIIAAVMTNVVMMNFCYDVPVKLGSSHMLLMALFLLLPVAGRLNGFLFLNRAMDPMPERVPFSNPWAERGSLVLKSLAIAYLVGGQFWDGYQGYREYGPVAPKPPLHGIYEVESFMANGQERPPLLTDGSRWRRVVFNRWGGFMVHFMDEKRRGAAADVDAGARVVKLKVGDPATASEVGRFTFTQPDADHLELVGTWKLEGMADPGPLTVRLRRVDPKTFLLLNRGFHWVQEYPLNR